MDKSAYSTLHHILSDRRQNVCQDQRHLCFTCSGSSIAKGSALTGAVDNTIVRGKNVLPRKYSSVRITASD